MSVQFILGRAGTGKTKHCFDSVVDALRRDPLGPMLYWIVPKQATFMIERELTCASGLPGFMRARIVSFEQLGEDVLADCGGCAVPQVTPAGRQMVLGHLLRMHQPDLRFFASVARQSGLAVELDQTFAELDRCGRESADLKRVIDELSADNQADADSKALRDKFHDLHLLYNAYTTYLGQERLDPHRRLAQVLHSVEHCRPLQRAEIFVDGFIDFNEYERQMLAGLAKVCGRMQITLLVDPESAVVKDPHQLPDDLSRFHRTETTFRKLWFTFTESGIDPQITKLDTGSRFENTALGILELTLPKRTFGRSTVSDGISLIEAPDRRCEVDAAARQIKSWLDSDLRMRDIAVLMRDVDTYHELIDASFREHGINYFIDRRRPATHHPLLQLTRSLFVLAHANWPHDAMVTILKSGLAGIGLDDADELENYVLSHRIVGNAWESKDPWSFRRTSKTRRETDELLSDEQVELDRINALRRAVIDPIRPFVEAIRDERLSIKQIVSALFVALNSLQVPGTLARWIDEATVAGNLTDRGEHEQVWTELIELFDQMVELMGDEVVSLTDFLTILDSGLEQFDLALTPPMVDQVLVGAVDRTRTPALKATLLLGMNEGEFPRPPRDTSMISDGERQSLREHRLEIDPDTERRLLDEQLLGYIALTRASSCLCLARPLADDAARPLAPSVFWSHVQKVFPDLKANRIERNPAGRLQYIGTPRQLVTSLMHWVHHHGSGETIDLADPQAGLYDWLARLPFNDLSLGAMCRRAWRALSYRNDAKLSPEIAAALYASPLHASVSRIETFAVCPFKHFAQYGLKLRDRDDEEVTALDLGNVYHGILENIVRAMVEKKQGWDGSEADEAAVRRYAKQIGAALRDEILLSTARNQYLLERVEKTLDQVIASQGVAAGRGRFRPAFAELGFGIEDSQLPPFTLKTPAGKQVILHGKIDRVDLLEGEARFAVIDYKLRGSTLALDRVYHGISLQLLTYLLVLEANGEQLAGKKLTPVAAFYVRLLRDLEEVDHPADATAPDDETFHLKTKPRGLFDGRYLSSLDAQVLPGGASNVVAAYIKKDGGFGRKGSTDVADAGEFNALLRRVHQQIGVLADGLLGGNVGITPFRIQQESPCTHCDFRSVCRFELPMNRYNILAPMTRAQVLQRVVEEADHG